MKADERWASGLHYFSTPIFRQLDALILGVACASSWFGMSAIADADLVVSMQGKKGEFFT